MGRFTIRTLMVFVVVTAVGLAALRGANEAWAGCLIFITLGLLLTAVLGAVYTTGPTRAGWVGFSLFGFAYLASAYWLPTLLTVYLPTTQLLNYVHTQVSPPPMRGSMGMMSMMMGGGGTTARTGTIFVAASPNRWSTFLPGAANHDPFTVIGHCLFALLAGLVGAVIARRFDRRRQAAVA